MNKYTHVSNNHNIQFFKIKFQNNFRPIANIRLKGNLSKYNLFPQPTLNCGSNCDKVTVSNVINVLRVGGGGGALGVLCPPGAKAFLLVTDNRRSWLDSPFCVITQHRKFEFGHHRQSKMISNAQ